MSDNQNNKKIQIVKIINYVSIQLAWINVIKLYLINFWNKNKALNNLSRSVAIAIWWRKPWEKSKNPKPRQNCRLCWISGPASCERSILDFRGGPLANWTRTFPTGTVGETQRVQREKAWQCTHQSNIFGCGCHSICGLFRRGVYRGQTVQDRPIVCTEVE